jgi:hypothetical protein
MATVDVLVTRYELDESKLTSGARRANQALASLDAGFSRASDTVGGFTDSMSGIPNLWGGLAAGIAGYVTVTASAVTAQAMFAKTALDAAAKFGQYEAVFTGAMGSLDKGKEVMRGLQSYAQASAFSLDGLAQAAVKLVSGGLNLKQMLPVVERLALATGDISVENLNMFADAMLRAKGGSFGEAMEVMRKAGIGSADLRGAGVKVSSSGEIKSSPEEFMAALTKIASSPKLMRIQEEMMGTMAVQFSNFGDAIDKAKVSFGQALAGDATGAVKQFSDELNRMTEAGVVTNVAASFKSLVQTLTGGASLTEGMRNAAAAVVFFNMTTEAVAKSMRATAMTVVTVGSMLPGPAGALFRPLKEMFEGLALSLDAIRKVIIDPKMGAASTVAGGLPSTEEDKAKTPTTVAAQPTLRKIEENTRQSKDALQAMAFGNGRGMNGITPVELSAMKSGRRSRNASTDLFALLEEFVFDAVQRGRAAGVG